MNGLLAVYKPRGMLSNTVVQRCKRILQQGLKKINPSTNSWRKLKVGHGGTLDKGAEGVLVLGLGRGTKLLEAQLQGSKRYKVQLCLGSRTDTLDLDGDVIATAPWEHITPVDVQVFVESAAFNHTKLWEGWHEGTDASAGCNEYLTMPLMIMLVGESTPFYGVL
eukprot:m.27081 g.27081  ORF g.27081 m.27081 type:complete len:165 (-) comp11748_c0_seq3:421-915(-)